MFLESITAVFIGILLGIITGLTPGIHINLVSLLMFSYSFIFLGHFSLTTIAIVIVSMSVTHTFLDSIPSIFLGAPESENFLSILPGHKLLLQGKGYEAVMLTVIGSLGALILSISITPSIIPLVRSFYPLIQDYIAYFLIFISLFLIFKEKKKTWALILFLISGSFGLAVFSLNIKNPLFPLFSGLFGISTLLLSLKDSSKIPEQSDSKIKLSQKTGFKAIISSVFSGSIVSFLPGIGSAQAAVIASQFFTFNKKGFLVLVGGINTVNMVLSFVALLTIEKARNGSVVIISKLLDSFSLDLLILFLGVSLIAAGTSTFLASYISKKFSKYIVKINYRFLCLSVISLIILLSFILSGFIGFIVLIASTFIGLIAPLKNIARNHAMACLILPVILYLI